VATRSLSCGLTVLVVDSSVWLASLDVQDKGHDAARRLITDPSKVLVGLDLSFYEIASVASRWSDPQLMGAADRLLAVAASEIVTVDSQLAADARSLAAASKLSAYDAAFVVAARSRGMTLVSLDVRDLVKPGYAVGPADA
jgi:predicted nucleic acid-binding protein